MSSCRAFSLHVCECLLVWVYPAPVLEKNGLEKNSLKLNESILGHIKTAFFFFVVFSLENTILHPFCVYFYCFWEQSGRLKVHQPHKWAELRQNEMIYDTRSEPRSAVTGGGGGKHILLSCQTLFKLWWKSCRIEGARPEQTSTFAQAIFHPGLRLGRGAPISLWPGFGLFLEVDVSLGPW